MIRTNVGDITVSTFIWPDSSPEGDAVVTEFENKKTGSLWSTEAPRAEVDDIDAFHHANINEHLKEAE